MDPTCGIHSSQAHLELPMNFLFSTVEILTGPWEFSMNMVQPLLLSIGCFWRGVFSGARRSNKWKKQEIKQELSQPFVIKEVSSRTLYITRHDKNQPSWRMLGINKNHRKKPDSQLQRLCYPQIEKSTNWQTHIFGDTLDGRHPAPPRMFKTLKIMR